jgi:Lysine methyltransferase
MYHVFCCSANVTATDLPSVLPLIEKNVQANIEAIRDAKGSCLTKVLDWTERSFDFIQADYILLADCVYYEQVRRNPNFTVKY